MLDAILLSSWIPGILYIVHYGRTYNDISYKGDCITIHRSIFTDIVCNITCTCTSLRTIKLILITNLILLFCLTFISIFTVTCFQYSLNSVTFKGYLSNSSTRK